MTAFEQSGAQVVCLKFFCVCVHVCMSEFVSVRLCLFSLTLVVRLAAGT